MRELRGIIGSFMLVVGIMVAGGEGAGFPWVNFGGLLFAAIGCRILIRTPYGRKNLRNLR